MGQKVAAVLEFRRGSVTVMAQGPNFNGGIGCGPASMDKIGYNVKVFSFPGFPAMGCLESFRCTPTNSEF